MELYQQIVNRMIPRKDQRWEDRPLARHRSERAAPWSKRTLIGRTRQKKGGRRSRNERWEGKSEASYSHIYMPPGLLKRHIFSVKCALLTGKKGVATTEAGRVQLLEGRITLRGRLSGTFWIGHHVEFSSFFGIVVLGIGLFDLSRACMP